jgi:hypothetical protein
MTRKLTDEIFALIPGLIEQGLSKAEIAARYEVTPATLQVLCCKRGISLRRGGRRIKLALPGIPLSLSDKALLALRSAARARGKDEARLASELLETIATDDLYTAVLDSRKEPVAA